MELYVPEPASEQEKPKPNNAVKAARKHSRKHRVALYTNGPLSELLDNEGKLLSDILKSLNINVAETDVSKDFMLRIGVPKREGQPILPYVYIDGMAVADAKTSLDMLKSGELFTWFDRGNIPYDKDVAKTLQEI